MASQVVGLGFARYVLGLEPLASASTEDLVAAIGPTMQRYLTGDVAPRSAESPTPPKPPGGSSRSRIAAVDDDDLAGDERV